MPKKLTQEEFIKRCRQKFGDKYDYSKCVFINIRTKIIIICHLHGEYQQTARIHLNSFGCPQCTKDKEKLSNEEFIQKSIKIHGNKYDYSKVEYTNMHTPVYIYCKKCK